MALNAAFTAQNGAATAVSGTGTVQVTPSNLVTLALSSTGGVVNWRIKGTDTHTGALLWSIWQTSGFSVAVPAPVTSVTVTSIVDDGKAAAQSTATLSSLSSANSLLNSDVIMVRQATSASSVGEYVIARLCGSGKIAAAYFVPDSTSTPASGSNSQAIALAIRNGSGGGSSAVASASIANATPATQFQNFSLGTITNGTYTDGNVLTIATTLTGTATLPPGTWCVVLNPS